jgi:hypothetical protein
MSSSSHPQDVARRGEYPEAASQPASRRHHDRGGHDAPPQSEPRHDVRDDETPDDVHQEEGVDESLGRAARVGRRERPRHGRGREADPVGQHGEEGEDEELDPSLGIHARARRSAAPAGATGVVVFRGEEGVEVAVAVVVAVVVFAVEEGRRIDAVRLRRSDCGGPTNSHPSLQLHVAKVFVVVVVVVVIVAIVVAFVSRGRRRRPSIS